MFGGLVPEDRGRGPRRDGIHDKEPLGGEARWLSDQFLEGSDEEAGDKLDDETERHLYGDQRVHEPAALVRIGAAFEGADRLDGGGAQRRAETEQEGDGQCLRKTERHDTPIEREHQMNGIAGRVDQTDDEGDRKSTRLNSSHGY